MADLMLSLVKHLRGVNYKDLTVDAIDYAKRSIIDTIGVTIAGSTAEGCETIVNMVKEWGGKEENTIWIYGGQVPAPLAGLAIGCMARARDFGDCHSKPYIHLTEYILPAALVIAECQGGVNGKDFTTAIVLAQDLTARLNASMSVSARRHQYGLPTIFGSTAAAAKLLGLDEDTMWNAMGLAFDQAIREPLQALRDGALTYRLNVGFIVEAAIKAALMAQRGITGSKNILQGENSFYETFSPEHNLELLTSKLGDRFEGAYANLKPYPTCNLTQGAIYTTIECVAEHDIKPWEVEEIDVGVGATAYSFTGQPKEVKANPRSVIDCQFSIPYTVATAVVKRSVFIEDLTEDAMKRPEVREMMMKVNTRVAPEVETVESPQTGGALVTIKTKDKKEYSKLVYYTKGHPKNPMTMGEVIEKFKRCLPFSAKPLPEKNSEEIIKMVSNLEDVGDVAQMVKLLVP